QLSGPGVPGIDRVGAKFFATDYFARKVFCPQSFLPTNLTNFRASECRTELVRVMPSTAENVKKSTRIF
ncbi:MAG: hypothetical protein ACOCNU_07190, partial [Bacteroidales bacterium]